MQSWEAWDWCLLAERSPRCDDVTDTKFLNSITELDLLERFRRCEIPGRFTWTQTAGPFVTLAPGNTVVSPSFTAPLGVGNELTFELVVDDGKEFSAPDEVVITVVENSPPGC